MLVAAFDMLSSSASHLVGDGSTERQGAGERHGNQSRGRRLVAATALAALAHAGPCGLVEAWALYAMHFGQACFGDHWPRHGRHYYGHAGRGGVIPSSR